MAKNRNEGSLLVIGGAEDPDEKDMRILPRFVEMAGGKQSRILVCSAPSANPEEKATALFMTGGDQLRLTALVAGTRLFDVLRRRHADGALVVAGTSAGAAAMSGTMIIGGPSGGIVRRSDVDLAPGLGLWPDAVVDTHFNQRGRVHRLFSIFAQNPQMLGIGIDEDTALELEPGKGFRVLGAGAVMVFDGRVTHTSAPDTGDEQPLAITDSVIHVLPDGYGFDLQSMRPRLPSGDEIASRSSASD